jgi:hypothetical protein
VNTDISGTFTPLQAADKRMRMVFSLSVRKIVSLNAAGLLRRFATS